MVEDSPVEDSPVEDSPVEDSPAESGELNAKGYRVVRFWNSDILGNLKGVLESIVEDSPVESGEPKPCVRTRHTLTLRTRHEIIFSS